MIKLEKYSMPSADLGPLNPLPDIKNVSYIHAGYEMTDRITEEDKQYIGKGMIRTLLPYKLQDAYNRDRKYKDWNAIVVENDYLKATFLPELGGRLWSLYDKENGKELLYKNTVFQPANLALRNAWFSGGVEFNVGIKGHNPLTCSPLFAEKVTYEDGTEVLKMFEYERIRSIVYTLEVCLPENAKMLYIRETIENTSEDEKYTYWWSNIAVPENKNLRIIAPADDTFISAYNDGHYTVDKIPVPFNDGIDLSYPVNSVRSQDYFYIIPDNDPKWIAAVDENGYGLIHVSDHSLKGRKLFVWGQGQGGRHWNEWLSEKGQAYVEIQAGLLRTQLEHLPFKPGETISWCEAYGAVCCDPENAHSTDWATARESVKKALSDRHNVELLDTELAAVFTDAAPVKSEMLHLGSGWGALENELRLRTNKKPISNICNFPKKSFTEEQNCWLDLLNCGQFKNISVEAEPISYVSNPYFLEPLKNAANSNSDTNWYAALQLGVLYYALNDCEKSRDAFLLSNKLKENAWALRNLAMLYKSEFGDIETAVKYMEKAAVLKSDCRAILVDFGKICTQNGLDEKWLAFYNKLPENMQSIGRLRLMKGIADMNLGHLNEALSIINADFQMSDIQEGEVTISHIWADLYGMKLARDLNLTDEAEIKRLTAEKYPLPYSVDFRMHE